MKTPVSPATLATSAQIMEVLENLIEQGHLERFAHEHPARFYQFATRVLPYYFQYKKALVETEGPKRKRAFVRLDDGTEIDF